MGCCCCGQGRKPNAGGGAVLPLGDEGEFGQSNGGSWQSSTWVMPTTLVEGDLGKALVASAAGVSIWQPLYQRRILINFGARQISSTLTWLYPWSFDSAAIATATPALAGYQRMPMAGRLLNMRVRHTTLIASADNIVYTLVKNAVDTALTVTLNTNVQTGTDLVHIVQVQATDLFSVKAIGATASRSSRMAIQFDFEY